MCDGNIRLLLLTSVFIREGFRPSLKEGDLAEQIPVLCGLAFVKRISEECTSVMTVVLRKNVG